MKLIAMVASGLLVGSIAGSALATDAPAAGGASAEAPTSRFDPLANGAGLDDREDTFDAAAREAEAASAAAASTAPAAGLVSIVPEPRPYQLLLGGIGAVIYMARRQWKR